MSYCLYLFFIKQYQFIYASTHLYQRLSLFVCLNKQCISVPEMCIALNLPSSHHDLTCPGRIKPLLMNYIWTKFPFCLDIFPLFWAKFPFCLAIFPFHLEIKVRFPFLTPNQENHRKDTLCRANCGFDHFWPMRTDLM